MWMIESCEIQTKTTQKRISYILNILLHIVKPIKEYKRIKMNNILLEVTD